MSVASHSRRTWSQMGQGGANLWRRGIAMLSSKIHVTHNNIIYALIYFVKRLVSFLTFLT